MFETWYTVYSDPGFAAKNYLDITTQMYVQVFSSAVL